MKNKFTNEEVLGNWNSLTTGMMQATFNFKHKPELKVSEGEATIKIDYADDKAALFELALSIMRSLGCKVEFSVTEKSIIMKHPLPPFKKVMNEETKGNNLPE